MDIKKIKIYNLFWLVAAIIILIGLADINNPDSTFDVNVYDTYYIIPHFYATFVLFLFYFIMGLGYWLVQKVYKKQLIKSLTIIHSVILIGSFVFYWIILFYNKLFVRYYFYFDDNYRLINMTLVLELLLIVFIGIPVYIVNLLIGLFRKKTV
jgi:heme/copper-type cytochrome/quinol oxidase subunit 1